MKRMMAALMAALLLCLTMCGSASAQQTGDKTVNIAVTATMTSLNPLLMDFTEVGKYTTSLAFLPLVELGSNLEFEACWPSPLLPRTT